MKVTVNGETRELTGSTTVFDLVESLGLDPDAIVVERNGEVVDRERYDDTRLAAEDTLELVRFVGGG
jgi:thiamine biosynthesis protein ThiS